MSSGVIVTPNMYLPNPIPSVEIGPNYAYDLNNCLNIVDTHNHTSGQGVQIPPQGININSALTFNNQQATNLQATIFTNQTSLATLNALYVIDGELWFNDTTQPVQLTAGGSVNATATGISSGTATASFSAGVLVVNSAANTPGNIQAGSILIGQQGVSGSNFLTLNPPSSLSGGGYTLTLPSNPSSNGSTQFMQIDTSGNINNSGVAVANGITASNIANNTITATQIANATITTTQISASAGITGSQLAAAAGITPAQNTSSGYIASSSSSGSFTSTATSLTAVTGVSAGLSTPTSTRPVFISFAGGQIGITNNGSSVAGSYTVTFEVRSEIVVTYHTVATFTMTIDLAATQDTIAIPCGALNCIDNNFQNGTYSLWCLLASNASGSVSTTVKNVTMTVLQV